MREGEGLKGEWGIGRLTSRGAAGSPGAAYLALQYVQKLYGCQGRPRELILETENEVEGDNKPQLIKEVHFSMGCNELCQM